MTPSVMALPLIERSCSVQPSVCESAVDSRLSNCMNKIGEYVCVGVCVCVCVLQY